MSGLKRRIYSIVVFYKNLVRLLRFLLLEEFVVYVYFGLVYNNKCVVSIS